MCIFFLFFEDISSTPNEQNAFVTFKEENASLNEYLDSGKKLKIDEIEVHVVMATPKKTQVFVGGLKPDFTAQILVMFFFPKQCFCL